MYCSKASLPGIVDAHAVRQLMNRERSMLSLCGTALALSADPLVRRHMHGRVGSTKVMMRESFSPSWVHLYCTLTALLYFDALISSPLHITLTGLPITMSYHIPHQDVAQSCLLGVRSIVYCHMVVLRNPASPRPRLAGSEWEEQATPRPVFRQGYFIRSYYLKKFQVGV